MGRASAGWSDVFFALGIVFLLLAVGVYVLLLVSPFVATPQAWTPVLDFLAGFFGLVLIGLGFAQRRMEQRR